MPNSVIRKLGSNIAVLDFLYGSAGDQNFCTIRVYERAPHNSQYTGRIYLSDGVYGDIGQNSNAKQEKEVYRLIDAMFPELLNKGFKSEGYAKYSQLEVINSGIQKP